MNLDVGYEDEYPQGDWYVKITIPKEKNWEDTQKKAEEVATKIRKEFENAED